MRQQRHTPAGGDEQLALGRQGQRPCRRGPPSDLRLRPAPPGEFADVAGDHAPAPLRGRNQNLCQLAAPQFGDRQHLHGLARRGEPTPMPLGHHRRRPAERPTRSAGRTGGQWIPACAGMAVWMARFIIRPARGRKGVRRCGSSAGAPNPPRTRRPACAAQPPGSSRNPGRPTPA